MDQLKRNLVCHKISYDIKNNLIEKECYELGYTTRYSSGYLARLLLSQFEDVEYEVLIDDSLFNGYLEKSNTFINVRFLEYGYNYTSYFKDKFKYLNECANYFKHYLIDNNLEKELDCFHLLSELVRIDNILNYCIENKIQNANYNLYLYFYEEKSNLASVFEKYINNYVDSNFDISFMYDISPLKEFYSGVKDANALERLEYYDLLKNDYSYEKIINEIINSNNISVNDLMEKYSISHRTAYYIKGEYDICNDTEEQFVQLRELVRSNSSLNNTQIIESSFIRNYFSFSSAISSVKVSNSLKDIIFNELMECIHNGYYNNEINDALNFPKNIEKNKTSILNFSNYLDMISKMDLTKDDNKRQLIYKFVEQIVESNNKISIRLYPLKKLAKL